MSVPVSFCHMLQPGDKLWVRLLPGRDDVRTVFGNLVTITNADIVRRAD